MDILIGLVGAAVVVGIFLAIDRRLVLNRSMSWGPRIVWTTIVLVFAAVVAAILIAVI